jgi:hypothetical protein
MGEYDTNCFDGAAVEGAHNLEIGDIVVAPSRDQQRSFCCWWFL